MYLQALGYIGVRAENLEDWAHYGPRLAGFQLAEQTRRTLTLRMDDRKQRLVIDGRGGKGIAYFGWEVANADALQSLAAHLESRGIAVEKAPRTLVGERRVEDLIAVDDPVGNRVEFFHGAEITSEPFVPGRTISGFRTGPLGLGHVVLTVERIAEAMAFYRDILGFGLSDFYHYPFEAAFFHVNPRHHSFALIETKKAAIHHVMVEHFSLDDVGQGLDLALGEEGRLAVTLGRHCGDYMTSFYTHTPSGFMIEHGWGGRLIDPATWQATERKEGPSFWGHDRSWMPDEDRAKARKLRIDNAEKGLRQPVQVIEGNYTLMPGTCPWWDSIRGTGSA
ncbi:MAG TPA: VOC family protein [Beijerinckiaceae bacterium]|jgi:2,3-dihydroxybiphenyl 1,2-dioxygenase|nr:VOC family protein [Beijerinckiaceae bacterium]